MLARSLFVKTVCALLIAILASKVPLAFAAEKTPLPCNCEITEVIELAGGLRVVNIEAEDGSVYRLATKTVKEGRGQRMTFWVIETDKQLDELQKALLSSDVKYRNGDLGASDIAQPNAVIPGPMGSSIYWDSTTVFVYVSHDFAVFLATGSGAVAILCTLLALIPISVLASAVCTIFWGLSAAAIAYYDSAGGPGFGVYAYKSGGTIYTGILP